MEIPVEASYVGKGPAGDCRRDQGCTPKRNGPARSRLQEEEPKGVLNYCSVDKFISVVSDHIM